MFGIFSAELEHHSTRTADANGNKGVVNVKLARPAEDSNTGNKEPDSVVARTEGANLAQLDSSTATTGAPAELQNITSITEVSGMTHPAEEPSSR